MMPQLRPFGREEDDLAIDFGAHNRAAMVTRLLTQCTVDRGGDGSQGFYRELSAGNRLERLLLLAAGGPDQALSLPCKCRNCREDLDLELTVAELSALQREADAIATVGVELGGRRIEFRKPKGRDLEAWGEMVFDNERDAVAMMIATLAVDRDTPGSMAPDSFGAVEHALEEADPLIDFRAIVRCGECGETNDYNVDLMDTALRMLRHAQNELVTALHQLASHYHWSEREIFAVPEWRRQRYLHLIAASGQ